jgi:hypothetical protein
MEPHRPENKSANLPTSISQPEAAKLLNVSERSIRSVKAIERESPERISEIESGKATVNQVQKAVRAEQLKKEYIIRVEDSKRVTKQEKNPLPDLMWNSKNSGGVLLPQGAAGELAFIAPP